MSGEVLGMIAKLEGRRCFPMVGVCGPRRRRRRHALRLQQKILQIVAVKGYAERRYFR
jgi:hypothetical protein